ncbi:MAG: RNA-binding domain-containing protein, partial [Chloroflexales bacterium]
MSISTETRNGMRWVRADLHLHTPASEDYAEPEITYLDILQEAERRELEIIAFTDHNTVHGYEQFQRELDFLRALESANRLTAEELVRFAEYRRLLEKITVLPGFEFTSHFGAHILGVFPPNRPISLIEATLLQLGVPHETLKSGICGVSNTRHVTEAYEIIARAGGLVIAPHVNGPNGVVTETLRMGTSGQSRIAVSQSLHLHALEFVNFYTDHEKFTSPGFYNGKTEHYERRMFCIQGSDAHRLRRLPNGDAQMLHKHGIGDRYIELLLPNNSFDALRALLTTQEFDRVRVPKRDQKQWAVDAVRFGGSTERQVLRALSDDPQSAVELWPDVAALANTGGGVLVIGCEPGGRVVGVARPDQVSEALRRGVAEYITPQPYLSFELMSYEGQDVMRVEVKAAEPPPYVG